MKEKILKGLKIFLIVSLVILAILLVVGLVLAMQWPWWVALFLILFIAGLGIGFYFLLKLWLRRNETHFVTEVSVQDESKLQAMSASQRAEQKQLEANWKNSINMLRKSHLKKMGNPLYVLPWYLVIGESGSGKSTSLNSARLAAPFGDLGRTPGVSGTRNCDWWFLEQAIVIDTAGRYAVPVNEEMDRQEWQKFLSLLVAYRKKEPLNGLILTIAADKLFRCDKGAIEEEGRTMRRRIDELMRVLGVKFPVYVLVTKCDLIQGVNRFSVQLPEESLKQPMGFINQNLSTDVAAFLETAMNTVSKRLRNMRMLLLRQLDAKQVDPALLLFPEEFDRLKNGAEVFIKTVFGQNPYQETPLLRGLFFSSGRQEGSPLSHYSKSVSETKGTESLPNTSRGIFLHDFFAKVLPQDRRLLAPTKKAMEWNSLTSNLGLTAWIVLCVALCGLLSFSFVKNLRTIREISSQFQTMPELKGEFITDMATVDQFRKGITRVEEQNRGWWIPRFGLRESLAVEKGLKERYCKQFHNNFMQPFDKNLLTTLQTLPSSVSDDEYAQYMLHLVRRINVLNAALDSPDLEVLRKKPQPAHVMPSQRNQSLDPEMKKSFGNLYLYFLVWRPNSDDIKKEINTLQAPLKALYAMRGQNMQWLLALIDQNSSVAPVTLNDFWGGSLPVSSGRQVLPSFTSDGKKAIDAFIKELAEAYPNAPQLQAYKADFDIKYRSHALEAWKIFAEGFFEGSGRLKNMNEWEQAAGKMASDGGPYFAFINRVTTELVPLLGNEPTAAWFSQLVAFQRIKAQGLVQEKGAMTKVAEGGKKVLTSMEGMMGQDVGAKNLEMQMAAAQGYGAYKSSLTALVSATTSRNIAYQVTAQVFTDDQATSKSPFYVGYKGLEQLKKGMGGGSAVDNLAARLISGPMDFLWYFVRKETSNYLEAQWNEQILAPTIGMSNQQMMPLLVGPDGLVWKFVKATAAPFLNRNPQSGYCAKEVLGGKIALDASLYEFLNKGAKAQATAQTKQQSYNVGIKGIPTEANSTARTQPHGTRLELQCGATAQQLVNNNFPVGKTFYWSPDTCGDVILQIEVGDVVLSKRYMGPQAFPEFLRDFKTGRRTFFPVEFPGEKASLEKLGIKFIKVTYQFIGTAPVLQTVESMPAQVPRSIGR